MNRDDAKVGLFMVAAIILIIGLMIMIGMAHCSHGHHLGVCGREYKKYVNKVYKITTCDCREDHY